MTRLNPLKIEKAEGKTKLLLEGVKKAMGSEINLFGAFANSPVALEAYLGLSTPLSKGVLNAKLREQIALVTAGYNGCNYCASAHTYIGERVGLSKDELTENLAGHSEDAKTNTALNFVTQILKKRGRISDSDFQKARTAGFNDEELVEIVAHVGMNLFTNYFNEVFQTDIDFPVVRTEKTISI